MIYPVVQELAGDGVPVTVTGGTPGALALGERVLEVSTSGYYEWSSRQASVRDWEQAALIDRIRDAHAASYGIYGARRVLPRKRGYPQRSWSSAQACT